MDFKVIGVMSGTSLDGLDLALCRFTKTDKWNFEILKTQTVRYDSELTENLRKSTKLSAKEFVELHRNFGFFIGKSITNFADKDEYDFISSHGHTTFHLPNQKISFQIGDGAAIAAITGKTTICDFRSLDICLNGQGAPLVPIGDKNLFSDYDSFLNIGGFANVSFMKQKTEAYDISPANFALNYFCRKLGFEFDNMGEIGKKNTPNIELLKKLNSLEYFRQKSPKSLSDHWFYDVYLKQIEEFHLSPEIIIATIYENISSQIAHELNKNSAKKCLVTGGGAYNTFLLDLIKSKTTTNITIPDKTVIEYKEALIFAFLGVLRILQEPNCISSVTGAVKDNVGGAVYFG